MTNELTQGCTIWQLPIIGSYQSMSYCIKTADDFHFVIDGGDTPEVEYLTSFIQNELDGRVDVWFITHPHKSHTGAFNRILAQNSVDVKKIVYSYLDPEIVSRHEPRTVADVESFNTAIKYSKLPSVRVKSGERLKFGKTIVKIVGVSSADTNRNFINNCGMIYKFNFKTKQVLFLGDVGPEAGTYLLSAYKDELKSDILQVSHHGYYGVSKELYAAISPSICLWPTRKEFWPEHSTVLTSESQDIKATYDYIRSLGVEEHYVSGVDGLSKITF